MNIVSVADIGINAAERLLKKKAFDELTLSDRIRQNNMELFGEDLSPTTLVHRIVQDVRHKGDEALFHYTKLLDRVDLTADNLMVSEEEFQEAERSADPNVVASLKKAADNIFSYHEEQIDINVKSERAQRFFKETLEHMANNNASTIRLDAFLTA